MRIIRFLLVTTLVGCITTKPKQKDRGVYVDPAFISYIEEYEQDFNADVVGIPFDFDLLDYDEEDDTQTVGLCTYHRNTKAKREIWIHEPSWKEYNKEKRRWLIYHEIAHCYENFIHRDFKLADDCPGSITNSKVAPTRCIKRHWQYYKDELLDKYNSIRYKKLYIDSTGGRP